MQKHIIKRLTFSLHFGSEIQAKQLEHEVLNIYRNQLEQLLDEHFSAIGSSDEEYQIDKFELNLGRIKPDNLRTEIPRRVSEQLSKNLNDNLTRTAKIISGQKKQLTLFSHFIDTGRLPWWAERIHKQTLEQLVDGLCLSSPIELKALMLQVIKDEHKLHRLINQFSDQCLSGISQLYVSRRDAVLVSRQYGDVVAVFAEMERQEDVRASDASKQLSAGNTNHGRMKLRERYWKNVLISLVYGRTKGFSCDQLLLDTLVSLTGNNDELYLSLVTRLNYTTRLLKESGHTFSTRLPHLVDKLARACMSQQETEQSKEEISTVNIQGDIAARPRGLTSDEQVELMGSAVKMNSPNRGKEINPEKMLMELARQKTFSDSGIEARAGDEYGTIRDPFTDSEEDYVYNAGLVMVWPYLPKLFLDLGMTSNNSFIDVDTTERAALLLQYLVEPDTEISESLLSLNKLLCGLEPSWPLPADFTPTEREQNECDALLTAVISHWNVLKNMSLERVRLDFFQREGILRSRDGNWQLQVEQQTHDILMQKLPWPIGVVKLPWMGCALLVDWD